MKNGELYVVYSGFDDGYMSLLVYGDGTPRIYKRGSVDDRLSDSLPVCQNMGTAKTVLNGRSYAVLLPLSQMVFCWGERKIKAWSKVQEHVTAKEVHDYVNRWSAARKAA